MDELQYIDMPKEWDPELEEWILHPSIGAVDIFAVALASALLWLEEVGP